MNEKIKLLFVDDQPLILRGIKRMFRDMRHKWDMYFAESGVEALMLMKQEPITVIISDMRMPGMDGAKLLQLVRSQHPETVRMILSGFSEKDNLISSARFIHQYLSKPIASEEIIEVIEDSVERLSHVEDPYLRRLVIATERLPVNPRVFAKVKSVMSNEDWSLDEVADLIWLDPAMTAMMLKLVNSSFFGIGEPTFSVKRAVSELGRETLSTLLADNGLGLDYKQNDQEARYVNYWRKSLSSAELARQISRYLGKSESKENEVYTAALLHDIGELMSIHAYGEGLESKDFELAGFILLDIWGIPGRDQRKAAINHQYGEKTIYELISKAESITRSVDLSAEKISPMPGVESDWLNAICEECQALSDEFCPSIEYLRSYA